MYNKPAISREDEVMNKRRYKEEWKGYKSNIFKSVILKFRLEKKKSTLYVLYVI